MSRRLAVVFLLVLAPELPAAQPQFWRLEGARDFLEGDVQGLSVDSEGRVRLAPATRVLHDPESPNVWSLAADPKGTVYVGTGNDGKVFKIEGGKGSLFFDSPELEVHALAFGPDGRLYVGTSPDGKVYAVDAAGQSSTFFDPGEKYVWALAFDKSGSLFVATGAEGRIYRVDPKGKAQVVLTSPETHILSLVADDKGNLFAGSAPGGIIYRLDHTLKVFVLLDSPYREIKALETGPDGSLYVAAVDGKGSKGEPPSTVTPTPATPSPGPVAEVTVTETFAVAAPPGTSPGAPPRTTAEAPATTATKGALLRILPTGEIETLWSSAEDTPHALVRTGDRVLLGTGNKGKLYEIRDDRTWSMLLALPAEQVTALARRPGGGAVGATSNPGKVHSLEATPGSRGTFTSKVRDAETVSVWGRLRWEADVPSGSEVQVQTRSGNTGNPDSTWTDWSTPYGHSEGDPVTSERARFLQVRTTLSAKQGPGPVLDSVSATYLQRNLRPQVQSITVHPPGEVFQKPISISGETEILGLEAAPAVDRGIAAARASLPSATTYSRKLYQRGLQTFSWKAEDPNGDNLVFEVSYRAVGETRFRSLRKGLTEAVLAWDTSTVPNGRYVIRVTASDSPSNPTALALSGDKESLPFEVDNTPPTVTLAVASRSPLRLKAVARDDSSPIRRAEYSVDGGRWEEVHPVDGINDSREETYEFGLEAPAGPPPHVVVLRAFDALGNVSTARVEVP
jgi:sugar lactone lactonase YvrE